MDPQKVLLTGLTGLSGFFWVAFENKTAERRNAFAEGDGVFPLSSGERER
jgi:hypothetical protein